MAPAGRSRFQEGSICQRLGAGPAAFLFYGQPQSPAFPGGSRPAGRNLSLQCWANALGAILPGNAAGVHSLQPPAEPTSNSAGTQTGMRSTLDAIARGASVHRSRLPDRSIQLLSPWAKHLAVTVPAIVDNGGCASCRHGRRECQARRGAGRSRAWHCGRPPVAYVSRFAGGCAGASRLSAALPNRLWARNFHV